MAVLFYLNPTVSQALISERKMKTKGSLRQQPPYMYASVICGPGTQRNCIAKANLSFKGMNWDVLFSSEITPILLCDFSLIHDLTRCEKRESGHQAHLVIRNLNEFDMVYLQALFDNDLERILQIEHKARGLGYGPLVPCNYIVACREQKEFCRKYYLLFIKFF